MYNFTNITNANSTLDIIQAINTDFTGGLFIILMLVALFVIILTNLSYHNLGAAFVVAGFVTSTLTGLLWMAELVPMFALIIAMILPAVGIMMVFFLK